MPLVVLVTQAGPNVGLGHLRRCLTLAAALLAQGAQVAFVLGPDAAGLAEVEARGFDAQPAPHAGGAIVAALRTLRPRLVVVDSYDLTSADLVAFRQVSPVAVLDDLAQRALPVDLVWNGGVHAEGLDYATTTLASTAVLAGPRYALLAPEYRRLPRKDVRTRVERVLVTVGGADPAGAMPHLLRATRRALPAAALDVALGAYVAPNDELRSPLPAGIHVHVAPPSLFPLITRVDLAVSAGGQTTYELAATGTPAVLVTVADNQRPQSAELHRRGAVSLAGDIREGEATLDRVVAELRRLAEDAPLRRRMSEAGQACVDGDGASRTASALVNLC